MKKISGKIEFLSGKAAGASWMLLLFLVITFSGPAARDTDGKEKMDKKQVVLIGASIGKAWDLPALAKRAGNEKYEFNSFAVYDFDKTAALTDLLSSEGHKPDIIIIKECASSFPGDLERYKRLVKNWVETCREAGTQPVLATTVPVVKSFPLRIFLLSLTRLRFKWPKGTFEGIVEYNDWIRDYAAREGLPVLDLEKALRSGPKDRYLKSSFALKDGLHINDAAYKVLDTLMVETLERIEEKR